MSNTINSDPLNVYRTGYTNGAEEVSKDGPRIGDTVPETKTGNVTGQTVNDLPDLPLSMSGISIDQLVKAVADEARRQGIRSAVDSLEADGDKIAEEGAKRLEEISKQIEKAKSESFRDKFVKAFKIIGAALGVIASAATAVAGFASGNLALGICSVVGLLASIEGLMSAASDGKISLAQGFTELGKKCGMDDQTASWFSFGMNLAVMVITTAVSIGSAVSATSKAAEVTTDLAKTAITAAKIATISSAGGGVAEVGNAVGSAVLTCVRNDIAQSKAKTVDIDAILEQIRSQMKLKEDLIESQMKLSQNLMGAVTDIVQENAQTSTAILTANPSIA